jgi:hypothetical protein
MARRVIVFIGCVSFLQRSAQSGSEAALSTFKHLPPPVTSVCAGKLATPWPRVVRRSPACASCARYGAGALTAAEPYFSRRCVGRGPRCGLPGGGGAHAVFGAARRAPRGLVHQGADAGWMAVGVDWVSAGAVEGEGICSLSSTVRRSPEGRAIKGSRGPDEGLGPLFLPTNSDGPLRQRSADGLQRAVSRCGANIGLIVSSPRYKAQKHPQRRRVPPRH